MSGRADRRLLIDTDRGIVRRNGDEEEPLDFGCRDLLRIYLCAFVDVLASAQAAEDTNGIIVYQTDFGLKDGAVSAMRGVAVSVDPTLAPREPDP